MFSLINIGVLLVATYAAYSLFVNWRNESRARQLGCEPGAKVASWDPILGLDLFIKIRAADFAGRRSQTYKALHQKYGQTFLMTALNTDMQTCHPENVKAICATAFEDWGVGPMRGNIGLPFIDHGIFTDDGEYWKHARSLIRPTFAKAEIADLASFERRTNRFLSLIPRDGRTFDIAPLTKRLLLDTATEFIFGESTDCLNEETPVATDEFMNAFDRSLIGLAILLILGPFRWPFYFDPGWKKAYQKVHEFVDRQVDRALSKRQQSEENPDETGSKNKRLVLLEEMAKIIQDPYELRMQIINVFFPAKDVAAIAFSGVIFQLARHPHEWEKLRKEVLSIPSSQPLTYEYLRSLKTVKAIINESLRLHPAASRIGRCALKDTILPKGGGRDGQSPLFVPKGQNMYIDIYNVQHNPDTWGPDVEEFKPDRWHEGRTLWESKWEYEPFLGGIRMCPAQNQVLTQLSYLLVRFAQEFETLENRDPVLEYLEVITMTVESKNGVKIAVKSVT